MRSLGKSFLESLPCRLTKLLSSFWRQAHIFVSTLSSTAAAQTVYYTSLRCLCTICSAMPKVESLPACWHSADIDFCLKFPWADLFRKMAGKALAKLLESALQALDPELCFLSTEFRLYPAKVGSNLLGIPLWAAEQLQAQ
jgi:hypothetical protein